MPRGKKFTAEQIIGKLREAEVGLVQGKTVPEVVRKFGVTEQTYYRWKRISRNPLPDDAVYFAWLQPVLLSLGERLVNARHRAPLGVPLILRGDELAAALAHDVALRVVGHGNAEVFSVLPLFPRLGEPPHGKHLVCGQGFNRRERNGYDCD